MDPNFIIDDLKQFLDICPTAWHAVEEICKRLSEQSFIELFEGNHWDIQPDGKYFVRRNGSTICAFVVPLNPPKKALIAAAHTDSPALKIKPKGDYRFENMSLVSSEIYGGPLLTSWFNRDLIIAGRIFFPHNGKISHSLIDLSEFPVTIPQLAIHLDRTANENGPLLNKQLHLNALLALNELEDRFLERYICRKYNVSEILGFDLLLIPSEKSSFIGFNKEMIASHRIDNLSSVYASLHGLIKHNHPSQHTIKMVMFWDNEEIGSQTSQGSGSPFFNSILERITLRFNQNREDYFVLTNNSICLSIDQAHALHPSYPEKHDLKHAPLLGKGITLKYNAQHRYATSAETEAEIIHLCKINNIPYQKFVNRNDLGCGSTIGPIFSTVSGIKCVDIGTPQLSMHSARELTSCQDQLSMCLLTQAFFKH